MKSRDRGVSYEPVVVEVCLGQSTSALESFGRERMLLTTHLPTPFVSQVIRLVAPQFVDAEIVVTSDVDMLALSPTLLDYCAGLIISGQTDFVVARDVLPPGQYPICYCLASPSIWQRVMGSQDSATVGNVLQDIFNERVEGSVYNGSRGGSGWFADQETIYARLAEAREAGLRVSLLEDSFTGHQRLDRVNLRGLLSRLIALKGVLAGFYTDFHLEVPIRPAGLGFVLLVLVFQKVGGAFRRILSPFSKH